MTDPHAIPPARVLTAATLVHEGLTHGGFRGHVIPDDNSLWDLPAGTRVLVVEDSGAAAGATTPEPCDECETTGQNCLAHRARAWAPGEWRCPRCGSPRWVAASLTGPVSHGGKAIRQCVPCGHYSNDPVPQEDPPAGATTVAPPAPTEVEAVITRVRDGWVAEPITQHGFVIAGNWVGVSQGFGYYRPREAMTSAELRAIYGASAGSSPAGARSEAGEGANQPSNSTDTPTPAPNPEEGRDQC